VPRRCGMRRLMFLLVALVAGAGLATASAGAPDEPEGSPGMTTVGHGTELVYANCYEHVGGFRVPLSVIRGLVGSELPAGFAYATFDPAQTIGQLNVVGLDCDQGGHRVTDLFVNVVVIVPADFSAGRPTLLRVRTYTNSPKSEARYGLFCFGNVAGLADVEASVEIDPDTGVRRGRVFGTDGVGSIELRTTAPPPAVVIPAATLQHFTVEDGEVHGRIEWGSVDAGVRQRGAESTLVLDGVTYTGFVGQQIFPAEGDPATFFHRSLTRCPPGLDWIQ
jgi:hypothetical protein